MDGADERKEGETRDSRWMKRDEAGSRARKLARSYVRRARGATGRERARARAGKHEIAKLVRESRILRCNKPILPLPPAPPSPAPFHHTHILHPPLVPGRHAVRPGCEQPFPNWTAFHVENRSRTYVCVHALPEFSLARHSVVTEGPRYVVCTYATANTDTHGAAVTVSYARVKNPPRGAAE